MAFLEQIGKHINDAGQNVAQQTKNFADVTQLNNAISEKEKMISELFMRIGKSYYENHKSDMDAEESEKINEINILYAEILKNREKINQIKGTRKCESCGTEVPLHSNFCNICGTKIVRIEIEKEEKDENVCPACHKVIEKGNLFCIHCGTKIDNN